MSLFEQEHNDNWIIQELAEGLSTTGAFAPVTGGWESWLQECFPTLFKDPAPHHAEFWDHIWSIQRNVRPRPFVALWPRNHGKSTSAETSAVALAARQVRNYCVYVSRTQKQADDHVENIAAMLESPSIANRYPGLSVAAKGIVGNRQLGWRRSRFRTAAGFTVDAFGLDSSIRGIKLENYRPDVIICDDLDERDDSELVTQNMLNKLVGSLIPSGSHDVAIIMIQNLISNHGIFGQLSKYPSQGGADFLATRIISGPIPAIEDLEVERNPEDGLWYITNGTPTWKHFGIQEAQNEIQSGSGLQSFYREHQHRVIDPDMVEIKRDWFTFGPPPPGNVKWVRGWDMATSTKKMNDRWASVRVTQYKGQLYLDAPILRRMTIPDGKRLMKQVMLRELTETACHAVESNAFQIGTVQELREDRDLIRVTIAAVPSTVDKRVAASGWIGRAAEEGIVLVSGYDWEPWIREWEEGFEGVHDDAMDGVSIAYNRYAQFPPRHAMAPVGIDQSNIWESV